MIEVSYTGIATIIWRVDFSLQQRAVNSKINAHLFYGVV